MEQITTTTKNHAKKVKIALRWKNGEIKEIESPVALCGMIQIGAFVFPLKELDSWISKLSNGKASVLSLEEVF